MTTRDLSAYTIAKNCCDKSDCQVKINELKQYMRAMDKAGIKPPLSAYIRFYKLMDKIGKLKK